MKTLAKLTIVVIAMVCLVAVVCYARDDDEKTVTVTGKAAIIDDDIRTAQEEARADALRQAIELAGGTEIFSKTETQDFELVFDRVLARSSGFVKDFEILDEYQQRGVYYMKVRVLVSKEEVAKAWGEAQILLEQIGRPRMMVLMGEIIDDEQAIGWAVAGEIENKLLDLGFSLVDKAQIEKIKEADLKEAALSQDMGKLAAIGRNAGAEIILTGVANAQFGGIVRVYGTEMYRFDANVDLRAIRTDTGTLLASEKSHSLRTYPTRNAARDALTSAGEKIVDQLIVRMFRQWTDDILSGTEITLMVSDIDFLTLEDFEAFLKNIEGVEEVNERMYRNDVAEIGVKYKSPQGSPARSLARKIARNEDIEVKITGVTATRIDITIDSDSDDD